MVIAAVVDKELLLPGYRPASKVPRLGIQRRAIAASCCCRGYRAHQQGPPGTRFTLLTVPT
jgi:hypothetical protein